MGTRLRLVGLVLVTALSVGLTPADGAVARTQEGTGDAPALDSHLSRVRFGRSPDSDVPMVAWQYEIEPTAPQVMPEGGLLAPARPFSPPEDARGFGAADTLLTVSLSPAAKPVRFRSDAVVGRRLYPFAWALAGKREVPRQSTNVTPRDPALVLLPDERFGVVAGAFSFATRFLAPARGPATGHLEGEVTSRAIQTVSYESQALQRSARTTMVAGRIWASGGVVRSTGSQCFTERAPQGEPIRVPLAGSGDTFVFAFTMASGSATLNASPDLNEDGDLVITPSMCLGRLPEARVRYINGRRHIAGGAGFFVVAIRGALTDPVPDVPVLPAVTASLPRGLVTGVSILHPGGLSRGFTGGGEIALGPWLPDGRSGEGSEQSLSGCNFGMGVPDGADVSADFGGDFRGGYAALEDFAVAARDFPELQAVSLVGASVDGRTIPLSTDEAESVRLLPDAPWDRADIGFLDGVFGKFQDLVADCFFGPPGDGIRQIDAGQDSNGRVQGVEAVVVHRVGPVLIESRLFATTSTKRGFQQPEPAIGVRARAISLDGALHQVRLVGLVVLERAARLAVGNYDLQDAPTARFETESLLPGEDGSYHWYVLDTPSGLWATIFATWATPPGHFAPVGRHPGPTSEVVILRAARTVSQNPGPTLGSPLTRSSDLYVLSSPAPDTPLPSYGAGLSFIFVPPPP